jgi:hypothetical protein
MQIMFDANRKTSRKQAPDRTIMAPPKPCGIPASHQEMNIGGNPAQKWT